MPGQHARLAPSAAERWISCPASVRVAEAYPKGEDSPYAAEGTRAHELAEIEASLAFGMIDASERDRRVKQWRAGPAAGLDDEQVADMHRHVATYVALIEERAALYPNSRVLIERRLPTGVPGSWGTSDTVIFSPVHVEIIDLKYGQGVPVSALGNAQLRMYGCGALDTYGDVLGETKVVRMTICQPRLDSISTEEITADELRAWRTEIAIPAAKLALGPDAPFGPSEKACRWCPAAGECRARVEYMTAIDFGTPDLIDPDEMADLLPRLADIRSWCAAVENRALHKAYSEGVPIPGHKVVMSGGKRSITNDAAAIAVLTEHGYTEEQVARRSARPLGELEKVVGKTRLPEVLGDLLKKGDGKPAIVPESDRRPAVSPNTEAVKDFSDGD